VKLDARRRMPTASVTDLRAGDANRALESLSEVLSASAGVRVTQYGGLGSFSTLSLRGAPAGQVSVFLDGVPLTSAAHGVVNLADLPVTAVERVEVYRGLAPLGFGAATPGGAVNLVTAETPGVRTLRAAAGSFGAREARGTHGGARGALSWLAHAGWQGADGDYRFFDDNDTRYNAADDAWATRINSRYDAGTALARLAWAPRPGLAVSARGELFRKAQGVPGRGANQAPNPRLAFARDLGALEAALAPADALPGVTLRAHAQRERSRFRDREGQLGLGLQDTDDRFLDRGFGVDAASPAGWRWLTASAGLAARREDARPSPPTLGQPVPPPSRRDTESAHAGFELHVADDALLVHAARRWDRQHDHLRATLVAGQAYALDQAREQDAPQAGARLRLPRGFEARANWSRSSRAPEFLELFGNQGDVLGNPRLVPERGESWDAGGAWRGRAGALEAALEWTAFASHLRQLIVFLPASQRSARPGNLGAAEIRGDELSWRAAWRGLALSGARTRTSALQTDPASLYYGRRIPQRAEHETYARLDARSGPWAASLDVLDQGDSFLDPINFRRTPARTLVGASLSRAFGRARVTLEGKNLGDRHAEDVGGYPLPGRSVFVACDARFGAGTTRN
jgi:outer membrane cobalamin receptor